MRPSPSHGPSMIGNARLARRIAASPVVVRLERMARQLAGVTLLVLDRHGGEMDEVGASGDPVSLPEFCRIVRGCEEGLIGCAACRQLITFGAFARGLGEFRCHGGVSLVTAPVGERAFNPSSSTVVTSSAFARASQPGGWMAARAHLADLPVDLPRLEAAYSALPVLTGSALATTSLIVDTAAAALGELLKDGTENDGVREREDAPTPLPMEEQIAAILGAAARDARGEADPDRSPGVRVADTIAALVSQQPGLPFTLTNIARAARLTPNHVSMLFRRHTGRTFTAFLTEQRLTLAQTLLQDPRLTVAEVAARSGFADPGYFSRRFKQKLGQTPDEWRRR